MWGLSLPSLRRRLFRCVSIRENTDGTFAITAVQHVPEKEAIVDNGARFEPQSGSLNSVIPPAVQHLTVVGTGYSCLQHLKCCPITTLKIDQSFVARLPDDARDQTIVRAVIQLAHGLGMDVIFRRRLHQLIGRNGCCAASS